LTKLEFVEKSRVHHLDKVLVNGESEQPELLAEIAADALASN
jgi:hypothetical protein